MGTYTPVGPRRRRSVNDALEEAEHEHILDSPTADIFVRGGATLLDAIFLWLLLSAVSQMGHAFEVALLKVFSSAGDHLWFGRSFSMSLQSMKILVACLYLCWTVNRYGGTPAKLLLGCRVVDFQTGSTLSFSRTLVRECLGKPASLLSVVGILLPLFRPDRRALHDVLSHSVVKRIHDGL